MHDPSDWPDERSLGARHASAEAISDLQSRAPQVVKRKRENQDGTDGWEEYFEYVFPEDEKKKSGNLRLLEVAAKWKARQKKAAELAAARNEGEEDSTGKSGGETNGAEMESNKKRRIQ